MFSLAGRKPVDLRPRIKARIHRLDGSVEEGTADPYGRPWVMQEGRFPGDNSLFTLYSAPVGGDDVWHQERLSTHHGSHVQGGAGHISHWAGTPDDMQGIWEMPLETFIGEAAVVNLSNLAPQPFKLARLTLESKDGILISMTWVPALVNSGPRSQRFAVRKFCQNT